MDVKPAKGSRERAEKIWQERDQESPDMGAGNGTEATYDCHRQQREAHG